MTQYLTIQLVEIAAGILLLFWALAARRSQVDSILLALVGLLLLLLGLRWDEGLRSGQFYLFPEVALGVLGITLVVRALVSRSPRDHRPGAGADGLEADAGRSSGDLQQLSADPGERRAGDARQDQRQPLSRVHRVGIGIVGCVILIPLLLLVAMIAAFMIGSGHDRSPNRPPAASNRQ